MHVGLIPDGNRRYMRRARINGLEEAYRMGISRFYDFVEWCYQLGVKEITIYSLSVENLQNRSQEELNILLNLFVENAVSALDDPRIHDKEIRVNFCGDREYLVENAGENGKELNEKLKKLEKKTINYEGMDLNLAIAYGGRQEILNAVNEMIREDQEINQENLEKNLWVQSYPDLIIRTSEARLSNFLLWQSAYSELYFVDKLWEEFDKPDLEEIINDFQDREQRYGR